MTTRIVLLIALAILTGNVGSAFGQSAARTLTLEEAIDIALRNNRSAKNAQLESDRSNDKLAALKTRRLPGFKVGVHRLLGGKPALVTVRHHTH